MFSGTIKIVDIDDYIKPSQECIKPLIEASKANKGKVTIGANETNKMGSADLVTLYNTAGQGKADLIKKSDQNTAKVSLNDCLACSGCVTTAESILVEQHSITDFLDKIKKYPYPVVTISPQARAGLSNHFGVNDLELHLALMIFFNKLGVKLFFDQSFAVDIAFQEAQKEIIQVLKAHEEGNQKAYPLLCSECPGWVCYAEKVVKGDIVDHMSKVKSPQQIMGNIVKDILPLKLGVKREDIYHASIQPCYDKKLEASRKEFERSMVKEVDTVLTAGEVLDLIKKAQEEKLIDLEFLEILKNHNDPKFLSGVQDNMYIEDYLFNSTSSHKPGQAKLKTNTLDRSNSHSYLENVIRAAVRDYFKVPEDQVNLSYKFGKNQDIEECTVSIGEKEVFIGARIYGFRNIQIIQTAMKRGKSKYMYVEVMACPSGCVNGGGQPKAIDKDVKSKDLAKAVLDKLNDKECKDLVLPEKNELVDVLRKEHEGQLELHTNFQVVSDEVFTASKLKW